jgi:hypothetical protein
MLRKTLCCIMCFLPMLFLTNVAAAISECAVHVVEIWSGAGGEVLLVFDNSPPVYVYGPTSATDVAQKNAIAVAMSAFAMNSQVTVRYQADGVTCTSAASRSDFAGIWIQNFLN